MRALRWTILSEGICMQVLVWHPVATGCVWVLNKYAGLYNPAHGYIEGRQYSQVRWS